MPSAKHFQCADTGLRQRIARGRPTRHRVRGGSAVCLAWLCLTWFGIFPHDRVATAAVEHASKHPDRPQQNPQDLARFLEQFLKTHAPQGQALQVQVPSVRNSVPACARLHAEMPQVLRARTAMVVRCLAPTAWNLTVPVTLSLPGAYYAAARTIAPGETLDQGAVKRVQADLLQLPATTVTEPEHVLGRIATQRITQGRAIQSGALRDSGSIQRGQSVRTEVRGAGFVMRGQGRALQSGAPGSQISVRTDSGAIISATVIDATTVQAPL